MLTARELNNRLPYLFGGEIDCLQKLGAMLPYDASVVMLGIGPALMALALLEGANNPIEFVGIDTDNFTGVEHLKAAGFGGMMKPIRADSQSCFSLYPDESIDLLLIDACHRYECVVKDIAGWWSKVKKGGIVFFHDYVPLEPDNGVKDAVVDMIDETWEFVEFVGISAVYKKGELNG